MRPRETSGITTRLIVEETRRWGGDDAVARLLELAGEAGNLDALTDERSWSSYDTKIALFEAAAQLTGDPDIARRMGSAVLRARIGRSLLPILTMLGSPGQLLRSVNRATAKFSSVADMQLHSLGRRSATVSYRLHDGYRPSRHDCNFTIGILRHVSVIFGLGPTTVTHTDCQVDGAHACVYQLRWRRRARWWDRTSSPVTEMLDVQQRFDALQDTVADLVAATDLETVLPAIARRASGAVYAERFLIAVQVDDDPKPRIFSEGFARDEAALVGRQLLDGEQPAATTGSVLSAELTSARRRHGVLAAFLDGRYDFLESERHLLESYARLGASALDAATAVVAANQGRQTAEVLLGFARQLLTTESTAAVTDLTADAVRSIGGCDRSSVWLWDDDFGALTLAGEAGWSPDERQRMQQLVIRPDDVPELAALLTDPTRPRLHDNDSAGPHLRHLIESFGCTALGVVPMATPTRLHGIVIAVWMVGGTPPPISAPPFARLAGIADQATTALQRAALLDQVQSQASKDELTGLTNRRQFGLLLHEALECVDAPATAGLLFLDLDRFKHVNDTLGHNAGDTLLQQVAQRLQRCVRTDDVVARLGGDEFTVLLPAGRGREELIAVAGKILDVLAEPIEIAGQPVVVRPSIGGVVVTADRTDPTELLREADAAMYAAKRAGGAHLVIFDEAHDSEGGYLALEADLHTAIVDGQFAVLYQPQVDLWTGAVVGVEALVRWRHPRRGMLLPAQFLPLAEQVGLIVELDLHVLRRAIADAAAWHRADLPVRLAVNVSTRTLLDPQLPPTITELLTDRALSPTALELELSASTPLPDTEQVTAALTALGDLGVGFTLDELGVTSTVLRSAGHLPVRRLRIDRSFVADLGTHHGAGAHLVEAVIGLGRRLDIDVVAVGVETPAQADALRAAGCGQAQGFLFGRPVLPDELPLDRAVTAPTPR